MDDGEEHLFYNDQDRMDAEERVDEDASAAAAAAEAKKKKDKKEEVKSHNINDMFGKMAKAGAKQMNFGDQVGPDNDDEDDEEDDVA